MSSSSLSLTLEKCLMSLRRDSRHSKAVGVVGQLEILALDQFVTAVSGETSAIWTGTGGAATGGAGRAAAGGAGATKER